MNTDQDFFLKNSIESLEIVDSLDYLAPKF